MVVLIAAGGGEGIARERVKLKMLPAQGATCGEIKVPRPWAAPIHYAPSPEWDGRYPGFDGKYFSGVLAQYELRQSESLLLGITSAKLGRAPFVSSPDRYAIVPEGRSFVLKPASDSEWESARVLSHSTRPVPIEPGPGKPLPYAGQLFTPSGKNWWGGVYSSSRLSSDLSHLALFTFEGTINYADPFGSWPWPFSSDRKEGRFFIDIYVTASGRRDALVRGTFHGVDPGGIFMKSFWVEGARFIMPIDDHMQRFVLCEVR